MLYPIAGHFHKEVHHPIAFHACQIWSSAYQLQCKVQPCRDMAS